MGMNGREDVKNFAGELIMDDAIKDIYSFPGHSQFTDPRDNIASSETSASGNRVLYYDKDGNYLFSESVKTEESSFSFWKLLHRVVNALFAFLPKLLNR